MQYERKTNIIFFVEDPECLDIERNIEANSGAFGGTKVQSMMLHWNKDETSTFSDSFDLIVASDW